MSWTVFFFFFFFCYFWFDFSCCIDNDDDKKRKNISNDCKNCIIDHILWQRRKLALRYSFFFYPYLNGHLLVRSKEWAIFVFFSFVQMQNPMRLYTTNAVLWSSLSPEKKWSKIIIIQLTENRETQMSVLAIGIKTENLIPLVEFNGRISHSYFFFG